MHYNRKTAFSNVSTLESVFEKLRFRRPHYNRKTAFSNVSTLESVFEKAPFSPSTLQQENDVFQCIHSGERFRKSPFSSVFGDRRRRISVDERPNRIKKYPFSNENGLAWTGVLACVRYFLKIIQ